MSLKWLIFMPLHGEFISNFSWKYSVQLDFMDVKKFKVSHIGEILLESLPMPVSP
jgi:hypothetical protein